MLLYKRYLLTKFLKMLLFLFFSFFFLYILIDYSLHAQQFAKIQDKTLTKISTYYFYIIIKRLDIALPLSVLTGTMHTLLYLNQHLELIAFQVGNLSKKKLLLPFFQIALLTSLTLYANNEYLLPKSLKYLDQFENIHFKNLKEMTLSQKGVHALSIKNFGKIFFSNYQASSQKFEDVFILLSHDHVWKAQSLTNKGSDAIGLFCEEFIRDDQGFFRKTNSFLEHYFEDLNIELALKKKPTVSYEAKKLSELIKDLISQSQKDHQNKSLIQTHLMLKILTPWISFICVLALCPFCLKFSRNLSHFKIYGLSLTSFVLFITLIDICVILSESAIMPPFFIMAFPFFLSGLSFSWNYLKKC